MNSILSPEELARFNRHIILPQVGLEGQEKLKQAKVLCIGTGGLGSPIALYLSAAGVGTLGLVDFDVVDDSNLQRQIAHSTADIGRPKVESARDKLIGINPHLKVNLHGEGIRRDNVRAIVRSYDLVVDGTDNFPTRYLVNDACVLEGKPLIYASIFQFEGQATVFNHQDGPCYRCLYPEPPPPGLVPSCAEGGVLGVLPGVIGVIQATEAIKIILGKGSSLSGRLLLYDAMDMKFREVKLRRDPSCPACGDHPVIHEVVEYEQFCGLPPTETQRQEEALADYDITPKELKTMLDDSDKLFVLDVREPHEIEICAIDGTSKIPLGQIAERYAEVPSDMPVVVHCKLGGRSAQAVEFLRSRGYDNVMNLSGGIIRWIDDIDGSLTKY
ncbi:MAG: molybdenum cofactor biosynthesis protein MoeB [Zetaproteobacteria bacterium CG06_land_8_20_14_3_00_59_53]|nr:MAG: molybdenum cofactor biosynthesis protein MoeB [Zetaproteobacteria bacterium CG2_30_59_37]PIO89482.1 MAG: molybdenum cofactor biosynthesis protein MoeB [Zetaproteobacteria bacterium CG23_combo_of_CG06-09_8_20_14_all_59_86]PIQ65506.1 MAG: molybdenum cofactor biosynthesis protein MoeB [Zetaproteobacteria bacterium CG11_big_fil_rev_8_21_14_0_20_59_439]PIU69759.1 MAG: molybdenum cofactor biosynthesis protein MoeB [Zetaproteobacteria bacterium CG06_land_8_20_14_3_00_59_53]PIU97008.1 MAG: moly